MKLHVPISRLCHVLLLGPDKPVEQTVCLNEGLVPRSAEYMEPLQTERTFMEYAAIAVAMLGWTVGVTFRLRFLLRIVALLLVISLVFSFSRGYGFRDIGLIIMVPQAILQGSYFLGLVSRAIFSVAKRKLIDFSRPETEHIPQRDSSHVPASMKRRNKSPRAFKTWL
jgi:uncharacterized membrane protein